MTDSPRRDGPEPAQPLGNSYSGYTDPAYASQASYGPPYQAPYVPPPTERLPAYSPYGNDPYATGQYGAPYPPGEPPQPPPDGPKAPRWLWFVAGIAVLMVIGLVIALSGAPAPAPAHIDVTVHEGTSMSVAVSPN